MTTPLQAALAREPGAAGPLDAFEAARCRFLAGERIDMTAIADELGVSRVTLHRWVGSRAQLVGEVLAELAIRTAEDERRRARATGAEAIARIASRLVEAIMGNDAMQALLATEPVFALRVLTTAEGPTSARITDYWTQLIETERSAGRFDHHLRPADLAHLLVRLSESFVYREVITGEPADASQALSVFRSLLDNTTTARRRRHR